MDAGIARAHTLSQAFLGMVRERRGHALEWSNGVTEGQIRRLKPLKRQSYGRDGFALSRQRALQVA